MYSVFSEFAEMKWMLIPFIACLVLSINHVYLGIHVIARKVIFVDLALAQIAALGAVYAVTLGYDPHTDSLAVSLFSVVFTFVGAGAFAVARMRREKIPQEAFIGVIYAAASAAAVLILSKSATGGEDLKQMLVGDLLLVTWPDVLEMSGLYLMIGLFHVVFRKKFLIISLDPERAEDSGINIRFWDILFYMSFGLVITKSVAIVGVLLVFSYLVVPAVIAHMWAETIRGRLLLGWLMAILASTCGIIWSFHWDHPTGPAIVVMLAFFLAAAGVVYYLQNARAKFRALATASGIFIFVVLFLAALDRFEKKPSLPTTADSDMVDLFLNALASGDQAAQLDAIRHLQEIKDPRIIQGFTGLLARTQSDEVAEALVIALGGRKDPRSIPALRKAAAAKHDYFLKLSIAEAQLNSGDHEGFSTLLQILKTDEAGYARHQALSLLEKRSGRKFDYDPDTPVDANSTGLKELASWYASEAGTR